MTGSARGVRPRMDTRWLALPLSARGLVDGLAKIVDEYGALETALSEGADVRAIGDELARLLCAFRSEYARVRRDAGLLLERGLIFSEGSRIRLREAIGVAAPVLDAPKSTSALRMRRHRERQEAARCDAVPPSHVTLAAVTCDARSDARDASHVTHALSLKEKKINSNEERARACDARRWLPRDAPFSERAREIAACVGVREPELVWKAFLARHAEKKLSMDWDRLWETWVVREKKWERPHVVARSGPSVKQAVDFDAPWLRAAESS